MSNDVNDAENVSIAPAPSASSSKPHYTSTEFRRHQRQKSSVSVQVKKRPSLLLQEAGQDITNTTQRDHDPPLLEEESADQTQAGGRTGREEPIESERYPSSHSPGTAQSTSASRPVLSPVATTNLSLETQDALHGSPTRSELDFDADPMTPVTSTEIKDSHFAESQRASLASLHHNTPDRARDAAPREDDAPPTPRKDLSPTPAPAVPEKDAPSPRASTPTSRAWSPSLTGSLSRSSSISLSRKASISNASAALSNGVSDHVPQNSGGHDTSFTKPVRTNSISSTSEHADGRTTPESPLATLPRSARSINRRRTSLMYVNSPNSSGQMSPTQNIGNRSVFGIRSSTRPLGSATTPSFAENGLPSEAVGTMPQTPRTEVSNPFSPSPNVMNTPSGSNTSKAREDGQTVMDLSKSLLAEIAQRERRIGELKAELKTEEAALKTLQTRWQDSVARDLAYENGPASPSLAKLRAPRQKPPANMTTAAVSNPSPLAAGLGDKKTEDAAKGRANAHPQGQAEQDGAAAAVPVGVTDALRGFSAKLPAGWGGQLNSLLDGLNTAPPSAGGPRAEPKASTRQIPAGLDALAEEAEVGTEIQGADSRSRTITDRASLESSASSARLASSPTTSRTSATHKSKRGSSLFGSFSVLKEQFEESLKHAQQQTGSIDGSASGHSGTLSIDGLPSVAVDPKNDSTSASAMELQAGHRALDASAEATVGWSGWSKKLREAATRAEKALGDAMAFPEDAENAAASQQQRRPSVRRHDSESQHNASLNTKSAPSTSRRNSVSPSQTKSYDFKEENQREKSALAELELGWLSNLMTGGNAANGAVSLRDGDKPKQLTAEDLLALQIGDGLVPEVANGSPSLMPRRNDSEESNSKTGTSRRDSTTTGQKKQLASYPPRPSINNSPATSFDNASNISKTANKRNSMAVNANNLFGMLSSAWGAEKASDRFDSIPEGRSPRRSVATSRSPSPFPGDVNDSSKAATSSRDTSLSNTSDTRPSKSRSDSSSTLQQRLRDAANAKKGDRTSITSPPAQTPQSWDWTASSDEDALPTSSAPDNPRRRSSLITPLQATPRKISIDAESPSIQQAEHGDSWKW
ncbi:unnamed protein product [Sympodiomycopsis kandeliae]